jgi:hypothetical protein
MENFDLKTVEDCVKFYFVEHSKKISLKDFEANWWILRESIQYDFDFKSMKVSFEDNVFDAFGADFINNKSFSKICGILYLTAIKLDLIVTPVIGSI